MVAKKKVVPVERVPLVDYLHIGARPYLRAHECINCGARYFDRRNACAKCGQTEFKNARVRNSATIKAFTVVHRAAPGVPAPYVSAIVTTDDGTAVRSNIVNCEPSPEAVKLGMRVKLTTYSIGTDDDGREAIAYGYQPA